MTSGSPSALTSPAPATDQPSRQPTFASYSPPTDQSFDPSRPDSTDTDPFPPVQDAPLPAQGSETTTSSKPSPLTSPTESKIRPQLLPPPPLMLHPQWLMLGMETTWRGSMTPCAAAVPGARTDVARTGANQRRER